MEIQNKKTFNSKNVGRITKTNGATGGNNSAATAATSPFSSLVKHKNIGKSRGQSIGAQSPIMAQNAALAEIALAETTMTEAVFAVEATDKDGKNAQNTSRQDEEGEIETQSQILINDMRTLQLQLINGELDESLLEDLQQHLNNSAVETDDAALLNIIKDIQLRATVELAKIKRMKANMLEQ